MCPCVLCCGRPASASPPIEVQRRSIHRLGIKCRWYVYYFVIGRPVICYCVDDKRRRPVAIFILKKAKETTSLEHFRHSDGNIGDTVRGEDISAPSYVGTLASTFCNMSMIPRKLSLNYINLTSGKLFQRLALIKFQNKTKACGGRGAYGVIAEVFR